jgi:tetratricopeptide (TPR) repeat protein
MRLRWVWAGFVLAMSILLVPGATSAAGSTESASCAGARSLLAGGRPEQAQKQYLAVLAADPSARCAVQGLNEVTAALGAEERLCAEGAELATAGKTEKAEAKYAKALSKNVASQCAEKGLAPAESKGFWDAIGDAIAYLPKIPPALGALFLIPLVALALVALGATVYVRWRRAALVVRAFADGAVKPPVGAGISALVEQHLVGLARRGERSHDGLDLDFVVADLELLAEDEQLAGAVGTMSEVSQLSLVIALLELGDRLIPTRRLAVGGELLPAGTKGAGISLALYRRNGVQARGALWHDEVKDWMPNAAGEAAAGGAVAEDPSPYYDLTSPASWWVQYEAARSLDPSVSLITTDARSFALLGAATALQREGEWAAAADAYSQALAVEAGNVAALTNLGNLIARSLGFYPLAILLLADAQETLEKRYQEGGGA